jgi:hypothetical protein
MGRDRVDKIKCGKKGRGDSSMSYEAEPNIAHLNML